MKGRASFPSCLLNIGRIREFERDGGGESGERGVTPDSFWQKELIYFGNWLSTGRAFLHLCCWISLEKSVELASHAQISHTGNFAAQAEGWGWGRGG